jgi:uncharacterized protein (DUF952 family)
MLEIEFAAGSALVRETDRPSDLPIHRNGPPGTFVTFVHDRSRISLPTDQIVDAVDEDGIVRATLGGMAFAGSRAGTLVFHRVSELHPEERLSPERSHTMTLEPEWVSSVRENGRELWCALVYKIVAASAWTAAEESGLFTGSPADARDGFIHFSTGAQVRDTASRHFAGISDLLLVAVSASRLDLKWESSRGGDLFPHLHAALPLTAVRWIRPLTLGADGRHVFPEASGLTPLGA